MAAPTFIQEAETAWNVNTTPKTTASFAVQVNDILVAIGVTADTSTTLSTPTNSGTALTWTLQQSIVVSSYCSTYVWTTTASTAESITVSFARGGVSNLFGGNVLTFRGSDGVGASAKTNVTTGAPTLNITTTQANSAVVVVNGDWNAVDGATRTWRENAGSLTEVTYFRDSANYTVYGGYHSDSGATGTYAVGLSAPSGQAYSIIAVEVKGSAAAAPSTNYDRTLGSRANRPGRGPYSRNGLRRPRLDAYPVKWPVYLPAGLSAETDTALTLSLARTYPVGQANETDTALALSVRKAIATGLATETDTALQLALPLAVRLSTETDTALALTLRRVLATGVATETDTAVARTLTKIAAAGIATETDTAQALSVAVQAPKIAGTTPQARPGRGPHSLGRYFRPRLDVYGQPAPYGMIPVGTATETDTSITRPWVKARAWGVTPETDAGLAPQVVRVKATGLATETDTALARPVIHTKSVGLSLEIDAALALPLRKVRATGLVTETDTAITRQATKIRSVGMAAETNTALSLQIASGFSVRVANETDSAPALSLRKIGTVKQAISTNTSIARGIQYALPTGLATSTNTALARPIVKRAAVRMAQETDTAIAMQLSGPVFSVILEGPWVSSDILQSLEGRRIGQTARGGLVINRNDDTQSLLGEYITATISSASVLLLNTTPVTIVAPFGAGIAAVPIRMAIYKPAGTGYGSLTSAKDLVLKYTNAAGAICSGAIKTPGFLDQSVAQARVTGAPSADFQPVANAAVVLHLLSGNIDTGTSPLYVRVWYDLTPIAFFE